MSALVDQPSALSAVPESPPKDENGVPIENGGAAAEDGFVDDFARGLTSLIPSVPNIPHIGIFGGESSDEEETGSRRSECESESTSSSNMEPGSSFVEFNADAMAELGSVQREPTDRYGFFLSADKQEHAVALSAREIERRRAKETVRAAKWLKMTRRWSSYNKKKHQKLKRRIRKGIPDMWRGRVWNILANVDEQMKQHPTMYEDLCARVRAREEQNPEDPVLETIERDITRTFPHNAMFSRDNSEGLHGLDRLRRVLRAYAEHDPEVGYCQGMGFFSAMFLIYMPEEHAYWQLATVMNRESSPIRGMFMPDMAQTHLSLYVMNKLVEAHLPKLHKHFQDHMVDNSMFASSWYLTIFASAFPFDMVTRVWDAFLAEGFKVVHRVVLALLKCNEKKLLKMEFEEMLHWFHHQVCNEVEVDALMECAFKLKLHRSRIAALEAQYNQRQANGEGGGAH